MKITQENGTFKAFLVKEINAIKEQPGSWYLPIRKDLRVFQELERPHPYTDTLSWVRGAP